MKTKQLIPIVAVVGVAAIAVIFRGPLLAWFTGAEQPRTTAPDPAAHHAHHTGGGAAGASTSAGIRLSPAALASAELAFSSYEQIRAELARDSIARVPENARALATALRGVVQHDAALPDGLKRTVERSAAAAETLAAEKDVARARVIFGDVSQGMVELAKLDPRAAQGWSVFECPMADGYKRWLQPDAEMANPYMGTRMLKCGTSVDLSAEAPAAAALAQVENPDEVAWWTCPMHPSVRQSTKGQCPICGMDLTPVTRGDLATGTVTVDDARRQRIGVRIEPVTRKPLVVTVRSAGEVKYDETRLEDVSLKVGGWIRDLKVDATGQPVKKGEVLFRLYSPELLSAQQEYLLALRTRNGDANDPLVKASRQKLRLWDLGDAAIEELARTGEPLENVPIRAPASGYVIEKEVVEGAAVEPGMKLYRIAALDRVWIEAQVYEADLPYVKQGMPVEVTLSAVPDQRFEGKVTYVYPYMTGATRTGQVRIELPNRNGVLRPQMFADVAFRVDRGVRLQVPASAIIYTGPRRLVFVDLGEGRLQPREVKLGLRSGDAWEVVEGLKEGDRVVTSGNFLIAAESRLRSATEYWGGEIAPASDGGGGHGGH